MKINYNLKIVKAFVFDVDGVLSPTVVPMQADGRPARMANVKDGFAIKQAIKMGYKVAIITGADTEAVRMRMNMIGVSDVFLCCGDKLKTLKDWMMTQELSPAQVAYAGDDIPDVECMRYVGLSVAPADADPMVRSVAVHVSEHIGGYGVARELIQETMLAQGKWPTIALAYG